MVRGLNQAMFVTPPMDVRARRGYSIIYNLNKLDVPAIYSSMFTNSESPKEPSGLVPRFVAALAEAVHFLEMNPNRGKADLSKVLSINDQEVLQSAYDACAKSLVNRRIVPRVNAVPWRSRLRAQMACKSENNRRRSLIIVLPSSSRRVVFAKNFGPPIIAAKSRG